MVSKLVTPCMELVKLHLAMAGFDISKTKYIESEGLDIEENESKFMKGKNTVGILYERGKINREPQMGKSIEFSVPNPAGGVLKRKALMGSVSFNLAIVTNSLVDLDDFELLHRLELSNSSFKVNLTIDKLLEQPIPYTVSYKDVTAKASELVQGRSMKKGFHVYYISILVQGYFIAPYVTRADIVSEINFTITLTDNPSEKIDNPDSSVTKTISGT